MKKENVNLSNRFFLLSNGDLVFAPDGLKPQQLLRDKTYAKVMAFEYDESRNRKRCPVDIVACSNSIVSIEEREERYFLNHKDKINYFYRNLKKIDHCYEPEKMPEKVKELIDANRIRIIRRWRLHDRKELKNLDFNIFDM